MRHASVVDAAGGDVRAASIDDKAVAVDIDRGFRGRRRRIHMVVRPRVRRVRETDREKTCERGTFESHHKAGRIIRTLTWRLQGRVTGDLAVSVTLPV